ncbi:asparagine synthase-related protein [Bifidobacterium longum]|uniref:asparagine synthase-related protein n=1 Tax=Bifidobacterium longum TaxID=216816 RepID=UPI002073EB48|nr:asparagine synthase-related protein [Bifidobacterium longum]
MTFEQDKLSVTTILPDWAVAEQTPYIKYAVPYLEPGHYLGVIEKSDSTWYVLGSSEDHQRLAEQQSLDWNSLIKSNAFSDITVVEVCRDGTWQAYADRFGIYPLYYSEGNDGLLSIWFDLHQVAQTGKPASRLYCAIFLASLNQTYPFDSFTVWKGVRQLSPGCTFAGIGRSKIKLTRVAKYPSANLELASAISGFRESVDHRLHSLLKGVEQVSCDLSGGLDSSYTAVVLKNHVQDMQTVFLDGGEGNQSDRHWATTIAREIQSSHRVLDYLSHTTVLGAETSKIRERMDFGFDESFRYVTLAQYLKDFASQFGAALHFNGHGGDELFGPNAAMSWSYVRYGQGAKINRLKNVFGFAAANKFQYSDFWKALSQNQSFREELTADFCHRRKPNLNSEKYDASWLPAPEIPSYCTANFLSEIEEAIDILASESREPYSADRSQHRIAEDVVAHISLIRGMNSFKLDSGKFSFTSLFLSPSVISAAMSLSINDRFLARVAKPLLYHTWPQQMNRSIFARHDKGEYSPATFAEFEAVKSRISDLLNSNSVLAQMGLLDVNLVANALNSFSIDGTGLDSLMRAGALEAWLSGK